MLVDRGQMRGRPDRTKVSAVVAASAMRLRGLIEIDTAVRAIATRRLEQNLPRNPRKVGAAIRACERKNKQQHYDDFCQPDHAGPKRMVKRRARTEP